LHSVSANAGGSAKRGEHPKDGPEVTEPLSLLLSFKQPIAILAKEIQRSAQAFYLRGTELPCIEVNGLTLGWVRRKVA